jgi:ATP-dependent RNA helicase DHX29
MSLLVEDWVSKAAAMQRRGRAGRVRAGTCFCCYTRQRFEHSMRQYAVPEVARVPLEELVLQVSCRLPV